ncbi:MAG: hypothetical protein QGH20_10205 [Candidatus Latescibacteria bacterium]|nr:hypothetical protein [Candidatus Latescibacterota bacterium]
MFRRFNLPVLMLLTLLMVPHWSAAQTNVSGNITTTTWIADNSPYKVTDTISVLAGQILTIEAGVDVLFDADAQLHVAG